MNDTLDSIGGFVNSVANAASTARRAYDGVETKDKADAKAAADWSAWKPAAALGAGVLAVVLVVVLIRRR